MELNKYITYNKPPDFNTIYCIFTFIRIITKPVCSIVMQISKCQLNSKMFSN